MRLKFVTIENLDFRELIKRYDKDIDGFGIREHEELAEILKSIKGRFLLSYNDSSVVRKLLMSFLF